MSFLSRPFSKKPCRHVWIMTAIHNHDKTCDFGPDGPWDGAYAGFCVGCHKWIAEAVFGETYGPPQMVAEVQQVAHKVIGPWRALADVRGNP